MAGEKFLSAIKSIADNAIPYTELTNTLYGVVLNIKPLTIRIENRFEISEKDENLQVSPLCMENYIYFPKHDHEEKAPPDHERILLWRGLLPGDNVLVLRVSRGQEYVVLYRLGNYSRDEPITDGGGYE